MGHPRCRHLYWASYGTHPVLKRVAAGDRMMAMSVDNRRSRLGPPMFQCAHRTNGNEEFSRSLAQLIFSLLPRYSWTAVGSQSELLRRRSLYDLLAFEVSLRHNSRRRDRPPITERPHDCSSTPASACLPAAANPRFAGRL